MPSSTTTLIGAAVLALASTACADSLSSSKRGLVYVDPTAASDDNIWDAGNSDLTWYYNYKATPSSNINSKLEFVPMLWGNPAAGQTPFYQTVQNLIQNGQKINYVLGFNEPDGCASGGSCIDAQTAAQVWISQIQPLQKMGIKLGAPAVTGAPTGFNWLQNWFTACAGQCKPDFIPVHWYGNFQGLASHMGQVNGTYPNITAMWITEYADPDVSLYDSQSFYNESASYFDRLEFVTHYSYFGAFRSSVSNVGPNAAMLTQKGQLTDIGAWYLGQQATGNIPKGDAVRSARFAGWGSVVLAAAFYCLA